MQPPPADLAQQVERALAEDIGSGDTTTLAPCWRGIPTPNSFLS